MTSQPVETDDELLLRIRSGDESAFLSLYRRRQAALVPVCAAHERVGASGRGCDAGGFPGRAAGGLRVRSRARYALRLSVRNRPQAGICARWSAAAPNVAIETDSDDATLPELAVDDDPLLDLTHREGIEALRRAVQALPRRYREVVVLCDLEEVDYADAAMALGCPIGTVRSRLHRARALLLEKLKQDRNPRRAVTPLNPVRCVS